jgi:tripartite-type tricarboxylate transporter receptor subunit TctC
LAAPEVYPAKPIRLIVPFPAGGGADTLARLVMAHTAKELGQVIVIENLAGAGGNVGSHAAAKAPADGYTLLYGTNGTFGINHTLYKHPGFDPLRDFEPVTQLTRIAAMVVVRPGLQVATLPELLKLLKSNPGKYTFASAGNGTTSHLAAELLKASADLSIVHVPYRGGAPAITDLLGGQVDMMIDVIPNLIPNVRSGRLRALAVSTAHRVPSLPDVPTISESGLPGFDVSAWDGVFVPKGTPPQVIARLQAALRKALDAPQLRQQLIERGAEPFSSSPAEFSRVVKSELERWGLVVKRSGASVD